MRLSSCEGRKDSCILVRGKKTILFYPRNELFRTRVYGTGTKKPCPVRFVLTHVLNNVTLHDDAVHAVARSANSQECPRGEGDKTNDNNLP